MRFIEPRGRSFDEIHAQFEWAIPEYYNLGVDVCDKHAQVRGDKVALYLENSAGDESVYTFGELKALSDRLAHALRSAGVERGDRVAIILPQRVETALAHIAVYKLGAIAVPMSVLFGPDAVEFRLSNSATKAVITDRTRTEMLETIEGALPALQTIIDCDDRDGGFWPRVDAASPELEAVRTRSDEPALIVYTSGTTGPPKGALAAQRCLLGNLTGFEMSHNFFPEPDDLMWTPADWAWTGGLMDGLMPALHYGVPVLGYDGGKFDAEKAFQLMEKYKVRNAFIPPTAMKMLMQVPEATSRYRLDLRSIMSAGEQVGAEVLGWSNDVLGVRLNEMWGQTEFNYLAGSCAEIMEVRPGSMGKPYPGHFVDVIDDEGNPTADGEIGDLAARRGDPVMFLGYWQDDEATREKCVGEYWLTGDTGYRDADGYLWFVGRTDDVISSAGHRIGPGEVEDCLLKHPAVAEAAVIGSPDSLRGQIVKAFIVLADGHEPSQNLVEDIQESVKTRLAAHEYPREIEFIDELPLTTTGKIRRIDLRRRERERKGADQPG